MKLWNKDIEKDFFINTLKNFSTVESLFYKDGNRYTAYWCKDSSEKKYALQSRNSLIGSYTEKWVADLFNEIFKDSELFAVTHATCEEIGLSKQSPADVIISRSNNIIQKADDILAIFEVKMSIVWNWEYTNNDVKCIGDFHSHTGMPSIMRSDSVLKAIGKAVNIKVSSKKASAIPFVILGNSPMTKNYNEKIDKLKLSGVLQGFWSLNPLPSDGNSDNFCSSGEGFLTVSSIDALTSLINQLLEDRKYYFSSMKSIEEIAKIIRSANKEITDEDIANKFLAMLEV